MRNSDFKVYLSAYHNEVTGSRLLLVISFPDGREYRLLIDCGYFQEIEYRPFNYIDDIDPSIIDAILITHNHIDHTGLLPKMVKQGYKNPIYMTEITQQLLPKFLIDSAEQQEENAKYLKEKYPGDEWKFNALYHKEDVYRTLKYCVGHKFGKTVQIFPGVFVTFIENGHQLGASMILVECKSYGKKPINFLFTGDYKLTNVFFKVTPIPEWLKKKELIIVHESTYGTTTSDEIETCFSRNLLEGFHRGQDILIGAFAQGRMQEVLYDLKKLQDIKLIPKNYLLYMDGPLGINTTYKYQSILQWYSPTSSDFIPKGINIVNPKARAQIFNTDGKHIVLVTTSGMLSNGPARQYVPMFLERDNAMIHLTGYAAKETIARTLLEAEYSDVVAINGRTIEKKAEVKSTREKTSHATQDEMLEFISQFSNIVFMAINHGEEDVKEGFKSVVEEQCPNVQCVDIINRDTMFCIYQNGYPGDNYSNIVIKKMPAKMQVVTPKERQLNKQMLKKKKKEKRMKRQKKAAKKRKSKNR